MSSAPSLDNISIKYFGIGGRAQPSESASGREATEGELKLLPLRGLNSFPLAIFLSPFLFFPVYFLLEDAGLSYDKEEVNASNREAYNADKFE